MAATGIEYKDHRVLPGEQPQPPTMSDFTGFFHEHSPMRFVRVEVRRLLMMGSLRCDSRLASEPISAETLGCLSASRRRG